jgi:hypothetical protein
MSRSVTIGTWVSFSDIKISGADSTDADHQFDVDLSLKEKGALTPLFSTYGKTNGPDQDSGATFC